MLSRILLGIPLAGVLFLLSDAKYEFPCAQGEYLNVTKSGRSICKPCPENTYWAMRLNNTEMIGARCIDCAPWLESPPRSLDISYCQCNNEKCKEETSKGTSMGLILGIVITIIVLGAVIASLFWCKTYGPELLKALTGRHIAEAEIVDPRGDGYEKMLNESPSPNLLDCDIGIEITDEQVEDTGYNNETAVGDHNDFQAVLRAAVISEKRRSRMVSMSSMTSLDRYRAGSMNSVNGRSQRPPSIAPAGYGPLGNSEKTPSYSQASELPLPNYSDFAHTRKAQTAL